MWASVILSSWLNNMFSTSTLLYFTIIHENFKQDNHMKNRLKTQLHCSLLIWNWPDWTMNIRHNCSSKSSIWEWSEWVNVSTKDFNFSRWWKKKTYCLYFLTAFPSDLKATARRMGSGILFRGQRFLNNFHHWRVRFVRNLWRFKGTKN